MRRNERAVLALADGSCFWGRPVGSRERVRGEVIFHTGMTGYQELLTDPASRGAIIAMTYPLIGNYGVNDDDGESPAAHACGLVVRELAPVPSHWRSRDTLDAFLRARGISGITGVDTRALTRRLRELGPVRGVLASGQVDTGSLIEEARRSGDAGGQDPVEQVSTAKPYLFADGDGPSVTVFDFGVRRSILRSLAERGCKVVVVGARTTAAEILAGRPDGVILSSGPGDPRSIPYAVQEINELIGRVPVFGIGLGHQALGLALGGETYRMDRGHRGGNHPVKELATGRVSITAQNHGFAVREGSFSDPDVVVTHRHVNDGSVEGIAHRRLPVFGVQFHPEASPGPRDSQYLFDRFLSELPKPA